MKHTTWIITFLAFAVNHMLRTCYAFNKAHVKMVFDLGDFHLGMLDALMYICYGLACMGRYSLIKNRNLTEVYLMSCVFISIFYSIIPFLSLFVLQSNLERIQDNLCIGHSHAITHSVPIIYKIIITFSMAAYGFWMLVVWQIMITLLSQFWDPEKQGCQVGFWASMSAAGNLFGFLLSNFLVYQLDIRWECTMILFTIFNLTMGLIVHLVLKTPDSYLTVQEASMTSNQLQIINENENQPTTEQFLKFFWKIMTTNKLFLSFFISYLLAKVSLYSFLMWYPIFLVGKGFASISGYIPMFFDLFSMFGTAAMGKMYEFDIDPTIPRIKYLAIKYKGNIVILCIIIILICFINAPASPVIYVFLTSLMGFFLGAIYYVYGSNDQIIFGQNSYKQIEFISNLSIGVGSFLLGLFQILIGFIMTLSKQDGNQKGNNTSDSYGSFFYVILALVIIAFVTVYFRSRSEKDITHQTSIGAIQTHQQ